MQAKYGREKTGKLRIDGEDFYDQVFPIIHSAINELTFNLSFVQVSIHPIVLSPALVQVLFLQFLGN